MHPKLYNSKCMQLQLIPAWEVAMKLVLAVLRLEVDLQTSAVSVTASVMKQTHSIAVMISFCWDARVVNCMQAVELIAIIIKHLPRFFFTGQNLVIENNSNIRTHNYKESIEVGEFVLVGLHPRTVCH